MINPDGSIAEDRDWQKNLITDEGMHHIFTTIYTAQAFEYCVVGTGNTPNVVDSTLAGVTATCSGTTVTASGGIFTSGMVGRTLKFDTGETARITAFGSSTSVTISTSFTIASPTDFAIWRTNITALDAQSKITNSYVTNNSGCGTFQGADNASFYNRRTFDFTVEVSNQNYSEVGLGWYKGPGLTNFTLFSRILFTGGSVTVLTGQLLRIVYELYFYMPTSLYTKTAFNIPITGWAENTGFAQMMGTFLSSVDSNGASNQRSSLALGEPTNAVANIALCPNTGIFIPFNILNTQSQPGSDVSPNGTVALGAYTSGSFTRDKIFSFTTAQGNVTGVKTIRTAGAGAYSSYVAEFATTVNAKTNLQTLTLYARTSFSRDLTNP